MSGDQAKSFDERIEEELKKADDLWPELKGALKPPYREGDIVKVRITNIVDFGAFCVTVDQFEYNGLIHIGKIANGFIENIEDFVRVGDELDAKVVQIRHNNEKKFYQIEFSLLHLNLTPRISTPFAQLSSLKKQLEEQISSDELGESKEEKKPYSMVIQVERKSKSETDSSPYRQYPKDVRNIMIELSNICGILSPESEKRVLEMIDKHGVFLFTKSMMKAMESFKPDLSYYLLNEIEKNFSGDGL